MNHKDHMFLIKKAIQGNTWADLGSGWGAFTLALRDIGGEYIDIYSMEKNKSSLIEQEEHFKRQFPKSNIHFINLDFTQKMEVPPLDGIIMANSLHYYKDKTFLLKQLKNYLKPNGKIVMVEYNLEKGNTWVPFPVTYSQFELIARQAGFRSTNFLEKVPLEFGNEMYSAEAIL